MKSLHIFSPGRRTASNGVTIDFTDAMLQASAAAYDPALHEAPIVVGHPKTDAPAYGWVKSVIFADGDYDAEPHQVDAAFAELVSAGRFKKKSAAFYPPNAPNNPVPGVYYLRHIGFLGAQPPAVKGLRDTAFADAEEGVLEFADWDDMTNAGLWRSLRDFFIEHFGKDKADAVLPDYSIQQLQTAAAQEPEKLPAPAYSENYPGATMNPAEIAAREAALKAQAEAQALKAADQARKDTEFAERETRLAAEEKTRARAEIVSFVEGLVREGKVLPVHKDGLVSVLAFATSDTMVEFSEGDKKISKSAGAWLRDYLKAQPKLVAFGEHGAGDGSENAADDAQSIANQALEFQESERKAGREISVSAAVQHITKPKN